MTVKNLMFVGDVDVNGPAWIAGMRKGESVFVNVRDDGGFEKHGKKPTSCVTIYSFQDYIIGGILLCMNVV